MAGVHASSSSVVFSPERISLVKTQAIGSQRRPARGQTLVVRGLFGLGVPELAVIAGVAAILFGPKKLPEIGKSLGQTVKSFQKVRVLGFWGFVVLLPESTFFPS